ncbi:hypothetical protein [Enterococcus cecorum]|uniref:Uncharacterized protein n=1 Tax=Enterococcus cecorum TaxID=44008 RepID=A0A200I396_9ENTE|nr:hypothetical protein [Enterococcus cecorum]OUZ19562.1 hypothetical protein A5869_001216 [Enterococcus cecorum]
MSQNEFNYPDEQVFWYLSDQIELAKMDLLLNGESQMRQRLQIFQKVFDIFESLIERAIEEQSTLPTIENMDDDYYGKINGTELHELIMTIDASSVDHSLQSQVLAEIQEKIFSFEENYAVEQQKMEDLALAQERPDWVLITDESEGE